MADSTPTKKTPTKRASAKKSAAKKTSAKKTTASRSTAKTSSTEATPAKKTPTRARKSTAKATAEPAPAKDASDGRSGDRRGGFGGAQMAGAAVEIVRQLTGRTPESVTGLQRSDDGWRVAVDVLELERIPSTTDVLATYEVTLDEQGELQGCSRVHRYLRGSPGDE